ncbi:hypothetical protein TNIN_6481 [Trichonephila inaurata madagascariensis]|uniref:Uncharacterized protein n=1 Tax=Trichonephila inaurata madagascariensis TaxID=2747483 RepID=A0A8X6X1N3_9ARAC|nr:hypothetical protein TNIN_6481 [Trichonephila inaurata madagascariensis]
MKSKWKNSFFKHVRQIRREIDNSYNPAARPPSIRRKTKEIKRRNKKGRKKRKEKHRKRKSENSSTCRRRARTAADMDLVFQDFLKRKLLKNEIRKDLAIVFSSFSSRGIIGGIKIAPI